MKRIKLKGGGEHDVFSSQRRAYCYTGKAGVCKKIKKGYLRRFRRTESLEIQTYEISPI